VSIIYLISKLQNPNDIPNGEPQWRTTGFLIVKLVALGKKSVAI